MALSISLTARKRLSYLELVTTGKHNLMADPTISLSGAASTAQIENLAVTSPKAEQFAAAWFWGTDTGTANAHAVAVTSGATNWVTGGLYAYLANATNTGAVTAAVTPSGGGGAWTAKTIKKLYDQDLAAGDIRAGQVVVLRYDGTNLQLLNPVGNPAHRYGTSGGSASAYTLTTAPTVTALGAIEGVPIAFKANHSNTGAATLAVDGLTAKDIVKENQQALVAGDILEDQIVQVIYDATLDDFVMVSPAPAGSVAGIRGNSRGLVIQNNATTPNSKVDVDADEITLKNGSDAEYLAKSVNLTIDIATSDANGLMNGQTETNSTWYEVWVMYNAVSDTVAGILIEAGTAEGSHSLPTNYTYKALVGYIYNDSGGDFDTTYQRGRRVWMPDTVQFTATTGQTSYTSADISAIVPPGAVSVSGTMGASTNANVGIAVAGDTSGLGQQTHICGGTASTLNTFAGNAAPYSDIPLKTAQQIYWKASGNDANTYRLTVSGYTL